MVRWLALHNTLLICCACGGASVTSLANRGNYPEAICEYDSERANLDALEAVLEPELQLELHVHVLDVGGEQALFGDELPVEFRERVAVVRMHYASNEVAVDWLDLVPTATVGGRTVDVRPNRNMIAEYLGESLPDAQLESRELGAERAWSLVGEYFETYAKPIPAILRVRDGEPEVRTSYRPPTDDEIRDVAPATQEIHEQLARGCSTSGVQCERFFLLPRTNEEVRLTFTRRLATLGSDVTTPFECSALRDWEVVLPSGGTLEERLAGKFGTGLQPIEQVGTRGSAY